MQGAFLVADLCTHGEADSVGCARDDAAGIAGPFAKYEKPLRIDAFERVVVARDA